MLILIAASGPDKGQVFELTGNDPIVLGRETGPVKLTDTKASREHARLTREGDSWFIEDLRSRYGTFRNHEAITGRVRLTDGDYVQVGQTVFVLAQKADPKPVEAVAAPIRERDSQPGRRGGRLFATAAMLALAGIIGANVYQILNVEKIRDDLAQTRTVSESSANQVVASLDKLDFDQSDARLARILDIVESQPDNTKQLEDIRVAVAQQQNPVDPRPMLEKILTTVENQSSQDQSVMLASVEQKLNQLLEEPRQSAATTASAQVPSDIKPLLNELLEALQTNQASLATLSEIHEIIQVWPVQTQARLTEILAALRTQPSESQAALDRVLAELRSKHVADTDDLRLAIRNELRSGLTQARFALMPGEQAGTATPKSVDAEPAKATVPTRSYASPLAAPVSREPNDSVDDSKLTEVQRAYKQAWQTGEPVTIGGGKINPITGKIGKGRVLDPSTAHAAGITRWEDWYMMDDFAERMRLQRQAMQTLSEADLDDDIIRLPDSKTRDANPQKAAPAN